MVDICLPCLKVIQNWHVLPVVAARSRQDDTPKEAEASRAQEVDLQYDETSSESNSEEPDDAARSVALHHTMRLDVGTRHVMFRGLLYVFMGLMSV